jgi:hypothetical protein
MDDPAPANNQSDAAPPPPDASAPTSGKQEAAKLADPQQQTSQSSYNPPHASAWKRWQEHTLAERVMAYFTGVVAICAALQVWILIGGSGQTDQLIKAANINACAAQQIADASKRNATAAESFSTSAGNINTQMGEAVSKLKIQGDRIEASRKSSTTASQKALQATIENFHREQRAWVGIDSWVLEKFEVGQVVQLKVRVMNRGRTPALKVFAGGKEGLVISNDHSEKQIADIIANEFNDFRTQPEAPISPSNGEEFSADQNGRVLDRSRFDAVSGGVSTYYQTGRITYKDVFTKDQWMTFCLKVMYVNKHPVALYCATGNDLSP